MRITRLILIIAVLCLSIIPRLVSAQTIPEEARRHMARGQAAVEIAKSPDEYDSAIKEFQQASRLAPDWPDPYFQLANLQEKTGKLKEAVASLKEYLRLVPNASDAAKIQEQIYKLEYKAEQVLTVPEIIDVLVSGFSFEWDKVKAQPSRTGSQLKREGGCRTSWFELGVKRENSDTVDVLKAFLYSPSREYRQTIKVTGPILRYTTTINVCDPSANKESGGCDSVIENEVEVVSKRLVKVTQTVIRGGAGAGVATGDRLTCTFKKK